ncbi:MAG: SDR family oxidoreductase [Phycisphaerales bacterium]|nr:MAG: SDR family oxidoreductase [Phycisphaerales bacterium]
MPGTALVTGGSSGIGAALVRAFAETGHAVWFTYNRGKSRAEELASSLADRDVRAFQLDLGDWESHRQLLTDLPGPVDILVSNAGLGSKTVEHYAETAQEQDAALLHVNATGTLRLTQAILPQMRQRGFGKIVIISSVGGGITQFPGFRLADGMSKAALAHLGRQLAAEMAHEPIDVFTVCPGAVDTPMFRQSTLDHLSVQDRAALISSLPDQRLIEPEEIAELVLWLCSPAARVLRGAVLDASLGLGTNPGLLDKG